MPPEAAQIADDLDEHIEEGAAAEGGEEQQQEEAKSSPEAVRIASLMGWKDPSKWQGEPPPGGLKSAEDFIAEIPDVLRNTRKKADKLEGQFARVVAQVSKLDRVEGRRRDADQEAALEAAMEAGDLEGAKNILKAAKEAAAPPGEAPAFTSFKDRNEWYGVESEATEYVAFLDQKYATEAGGPANVDPETHFRKIDAAVKKRFPELFGEAKEPKEGEETGERRRAPLVNRGNRAERVKTSEGFTVADLTRAHRQAIKEYGCSEADYVKNLNLMNKGADR